MDERVFLVVGAGAVAASAVAETLSGVEGKVVIVDDPTDWAATEERIAAAMGVDLADVTALKLRDEDKLERIRTLYEAPELREPPDPCLAGLELRSRDHGSPRSIKETFRRPRRQKKRR